MKLSELEPRFVRYEGASITHHSFSLAEAQGIDFLCPKCFEKNGGPVGTEHVEVTFAGRGATDEQGSHNKDGKPTRWNVSGSGFEDLTTTPSIQLEGGCAWHGFITNGEIK